MSKRYPVGDVTISIKGRNMTVTDAMRNRVMQKMDHLDRYLDRLSQIDVLLCEEHASRPEQRMVAEVTARAGRRQLRARSTAGDITAAIDLVVDKLHLLLTRQKERTRQHKAAGVSATSIAIEPGADADVVGEDDLPADETTGAIVAKKQYTMKPLFADEAIDELEALGHDFFVFLNAETEHVNVLYKRRDGKYGLIEPAFE